MWPFPTKEKPKTTRQSGEHLKPRVIQLENEITTLKERLKEIVGLVQNERDNPFVIKPSVIKAPVKIQKPLRKAYTYQNLTPKQRPLLNGPGLFRLHIYSTRTSLLAHHHYEFEALSLDHAKEIVSYYIERYIESLEPSQRNILSSCCFGRIVSSTEKRMIIGQKITVGRMSKPYTFYRYNKRKKIKSCLV